MKPKGERLAHEPELVATVDTRIRFVLQPRDRATDLAEELVPVPQEALVDLEEGGSEGDAPVVCPGRRIALLIDPFHVHCQPRLGYRAAVQKARVQEEQHAPQCGAAADDRLVNDVVPGTGRFPRLQINVEDSIELVTQVAYLAAFQQADTFVLMNLGFTLLMMLYDVIAKVLR